MSRVIRVLDMRAGRNLKGHMSDPFNFEGRASGIMTINVRRSILLSYVRVTEFVAGAAVDPLVVPHLPFAKWPPTVISTLLHLTTLVCDALLLVLSASRLRLCYYDIVRQFSIGT